jgi:sugar fermentation stimulation protein A
MQFTPPLIPAKLIKRYQRFLADVLLDDGSQITVHCPNTGSMKACWEADWRVYLADSNNPKRKYRYTWVISENPLGERIGVNTHLANKLVEEAIRCGKVSEVQQPLTIQREVKYGQENSKIDLLVQTPQQPVYIEVKSVTLKEADGMGYFPDAVSVRGQKHLRELIELKQSSDARAVLFFCVQHSGINEVKPAQHIDPHYAKLLEAAHKAGVEIFAYGVILDLNEISLER